MDPYDEFPSPYTGIGNDPVNNVDPSGGFLGLSPLASVGVSTLGGAIVGTAVDILNGGDGTTGAAIGAGVGLLAGVAGTYGIRAIAGAASDGVSMALNETNQYIQYTSNNTIINEGQLRKDGSRIFANQNDAYSWMYSQSIKNNYREQLGVILTKFVLVLPDFKNLQSETIPETYGYKWENGNLYDPVTKSLLSVVATLHTHLSPWGDATPSGDDVKYFSRRTPNKPYLTMGSNGNVYGNYGKWLMRKDGGYYVSDIENTQIAFDRGGVERVTNGAIMKNFALREYLQWYMKNVAKIK